MKEFKEFLGEDVLNESFAKNKMLGVNYSMFGLNFMSTPKISYIPKGIKKFNSNGESVVWDSDDIDSEKDNKKIKKQILTLEKTADKKLKAKIDSFMGDIENDYKKLVSDINSLIK